MVRESKWILCGDCGKNHWSDELCTGDHAPPPPAVPAPQQDSLEDVPLNKDALFAATRFARHLLDANCKDTPFDVAKHSHYCGQLEGARREREKQGHATRTAFCQKLEIADLAEVIAKKDAEIARLNGELGVIGYVSADGARIKKLHDEITHLRSDLDIAREALEFYAGNRPKEAVWKHAMLMGTDKFGCLDDDLSGPKVALDAVSSFEKFLDGGGDE